MAPASKASRSIKTTRATRSETDSFGPIEVAADRYWGAQTERSRQNFRIGQDRMPMLDELHTALRKKEKAFAHIVKIGRTHTQDATPLTLGQEFSGYASQVESGIARLRVAVKDLYPLAQGGTAVGTGLNSKPGFAKLFAKHVAAITKMPFTSAQNKFEALASNDAYVLVHGAINSVATGLF